MDLEELTQKIVQKQIEESQSTTQKDDQSQSQEVLVNSNPENQQHNQIIHDLSTNEQQQLQQQQIIKYEQQLDDDLIDEEYECEHELCKRQTKALIIKITEYEKALKEVQTREHDLSKSFQNTQKENEEKIKQLENRIKQMTQLEAQKNKGTVVLPIQELQTIYGEQEKSKKLIGQLQESLQKLQNVQSNQNKNQIKIESLEEQNKILRELVDEHAATQQTEKEELARLKEMVPFLQKDLEVKSNTIDSLRTDLKSKFILQQQIDGFKTQLEQQKLQIQQNIGLQRQVDESNVQCKLAQNEAQLAQLESERLKAGIQELACQQASVSKEMNSLKREHIENKKLILDLESQIERQVQEKATVEAQLASINEKMEDQSQAHKLQSKNIINENKELKKTITEQLKQIASLLDEKRQHDSTMDHLHIMMMQKQNSEQSNIATTNSTNISLSAQSTSEKGILEAMSNKIQKQELKIITYIEKIKTLEQQKLALQADVFNKESLINQMLQNNYAQSDQHGHQIHDLLDRLDNEEKQLVIQQSKQNKIEEMQKILEQTLVENFRLKKDMAQLGAELNNTLRIQILNQHENKQHYK